MRCSMRINPDFADILFSSLLYSYSCVAYVSLLMTCDYARRLTSFFPF